MVASNKGKSHAQTHIINDKSQNPVHFCLKKSQNEDISRNKKTPGDPGLVMSYWIDCWVTWCPEDEPW